jgi:hypothetical protein
MGPIALDESFKVVRVELVSFYTSVLHGSLCFLGRCINHLFPFFFVTLMLYYSLSHILFFTLFSHLLLRVVFLKNNRHSMLDSIRFDIFELEHWSYSIRHDFFEFEY